MRKLKVKAGEEQIQTKEHATSLLVDEAVSVDQEIKRLTTKLSDMKERLKAIAKSQGVSELSGHFGKASFQHITEFEIDADQFYNWLLTHRKSNVFRDFVKVDKTKVRTAMGEAPLREGGKERINMYHKVVLSERK